MTREEMIKKVCEGVVKNTEYYSIEHGQYRCMYCEAISDSDRKVTSHKEDCPVLYAEVLLATPVIEVGDVVKIQESDDEYYVCRIVQQYGYSYPWYCLSKESPWSEHTKKYKNPTLVRKGGNDNDFERKEK